MSADVTPSRPGRDPCPSGRQWHLSHGDQRVTIVEVGGGIREYVDGERDVLHPYSRDDMADGAHGAPLIPWPNRVADGRYTFDGSDYQLALTEPEKHNAIHGLLRWRSWDRVDHSRARVVVGTRLHPMTGWPFLLDVAITYELGDEGLSVETRATNIGQGPCPYASGQHPYVSPGEGESVDGCTLQLRAGTRVLTDPDRQLPTGLEPVAGTEYDFASQRRLGALELDDAFTDLERGEDGRAQVRLACPDGRTAELWADASYPVIQLYTADTLAPARRRRGLAVEPMTAPANALQSGEMLVRLAPGEEHVARWGVRLV
jgi:aldose 1-epimerase